MITTALRTKALAYEDLTDDIGSRLYWKDMPQNPTYPAITYFRVSGPRHHDIDVAYPRYQFDIWTQDAAVAERVADNLRKALQRESGSWSGKSVIQCVFLGDRDVPDEEDQPHHIASEFKIIYREE